MVRDTAHAYAQEKLLPRVRDAFRNENDRSGDLSRDGRARLARRHVARRSTAAPGSITSATASIAREIERVDSGYRSMMSVQSSLVMFPIHAYGSEAQRMRYLPTLATRRVDRMLRPHRAEPRLGSRLDGNARPQHRRRLPADRREDVDLELADRRRVRRLGEARRRHPRIHPRERDEGTVRAEDRRQVLAARVDHRRDRDGRRLRAGRQPAAERQGLEGPDGMPQQRALRHRLGCAGRRRVLLAGGAPVRAGPQAVRPAARREPARSRRSSPTCRPRSRSACRGACASAA